MNVKFNIHIIDEPVEKATINNLKGKPVCKSDAIVVFIRGSRWSIVSLRSSFTSRDGKGEAD
jgi:hypothetical protein